MKCPYCGHEPAFACGYHCDCFLMSHRCAIVEQTLVWCDTCDRSEWGKDTNEAVRKIGGTR